MNLTFILYDMVAYAHVRGCALRGCTYLYGYVQDVQTAARR